MCICSNIIIINNNKKIFYESVWVVLWKQLNLFHVYLVYNL